MYLKYLVATFYVKVLFKQVAFTHTELPDEIIEPVKRAVNYMAALCSNEGALELIKTQSLVSYSIFLY